MLARFAFMGAAVLIAGLMAPLQAWGASPVPAEAGFFRSIDGGDIDLAAWRGRPVLVVNTASRCGFTRQFDALQALQDRYREAGLVVLGVPSDSFGQELGSAAAVRDFCEVNFAIDFPMTDIVPVRGAGAHPFFAWAAGQGAAPRWNFHKILLDGEGRIAAAFPAQVPPEAPQVAAAVEAALGR